jgi:diadenosine tetraphosphate (Ap4A) HIT family hydrolase
MKDFNKIDSKNILYRNEYFFIIKDAYPVSEGHLLIISNSVKTDYFDLTKEEKINITELITIAKKLIEMEYKPDGYNIGMNCGAAAGQTVFHFHCHIIPRYYGDMQNPQGGIRHCINGKGNYKF